MNAFAFSWCCARNGSQPRSLNLFVGGVAPRCGRLVGCKHLQIADLSANDINTIKLGV